MSFLDTNKDRAALIIGLLAIGLAVALFPYASGLLGAPVLYVLFRPFHRALAKTIPRSAAAGLVILTAFAVIVVPGVWLIGMLVGQAQGVARSLVNSPLLDRLSNLQIGEFALGPELAGIGRSIIGWLGDSALGFIGTATHFTLNLLFSFFGLYYMLMSPEGGWKAVRHFVPFSDRNAESLRERFKAVTMGTIVGTGLTALIQGIVIGGAFWLTGLSNPVFWGVVTVVFAILPVVGSGIIWIPGAISLALSGHTGGAVILAIVGVLAGQVHTLIGPAVTKRYAEIHPMITLVGAIAGVSYFGLIGLLIGPLALSYFFELIRMYKEEYLEA
jgi:predicted PurR-regulated permease PerM